MALICIEFVFQKIQSQIQIKNQFTDQDFAWSVISWTGKMKLGSDQTNQIINHNFKIFN